MLTIMEKGCHVISFIRYLPTLLYYLPMLVKTDGLHFVTVWVVAYHPKS